MASCLSRYDTLCFQARKWVVENIEMYENHLKWREETFPIPNQMG